MEKPFEEKLMEISREKYGKSLKSLDKKELYNLIGALINEKCAYHKKDDLSKKRAAYFSIEYLIGRLIESNLYNMRNIDLTEKSLQDNSQSLLNLSDIDDYAFGNGGLGRLAACFLDSAASCEIPLDGYGIRYKYGLFKQVFGSGGQQKELPDDWNKYGDPFGIKKEKECVTVNFADYSVKAIPFDYHIIGYNFKRINTLRLYECKKIDCHENDAKRIYEYLYPDDSTYEGKKLRLRQQYFLVSASLQNIVNRYGLESIEDKIKIQLNDTHPVVAIPEFINICVKKQMDFLTALEKCRKIFAYTNHTVMPEALEEWDCNLMREVIPEVYGVIQKINDMLKLDLENNEKVPFDKYAIVFEGKVKMANLACFVCSDINGVAELHTDILKKRVLSHWYELYPDKFSNKTNGIAQRRWLGLSNVSLTDFLSKLCGCDIIEETENIDRLLKFKDDEGVLTQLHEIKQVNKKALCQHIQEKEKVTLDPESVFFVQVKRIHEYKRQLLGIFLAIYLYHKVKKGEMESLPNMTFIFGGKAASSYKIAKSIIKFINNVARVINTDESIGGKIKVVFCENYNVTYAQKIIPAADVSLQISLAGTEASGTGNMKFMMNGAVTLGTYDGANIEICEKAGEENNYIFGMREEEVARLKRSYDPRKLYEGNSAIKSIVDTLIDGSFADEEEFRDIFDSLLNSDEPDRFMVLADLMSFIETGIKAAKDYTDTLAFSKKCLMNIGSSSYFSADRTVREYAEDIWFK